jgi:hypothetical protein
VFGQRGRFGRGDLTGLALDHDVEIDELLRDGRHLVGEAEGVLAHFVGCKDVIPLPFPLAI